MTMMKTSYKMKKTKVEKENVEEGYKKNKMMTSSHMKKMMEVEQNKRRKSKME